MSENQEEGGRSEDLWLFLHDGRIEKSLFTPLSRAVTSYWGRRLKHDTQLVWKGTLSWENADKDVTEI